MVQVFADITNITIFVFGLITGSFLNCVIYRLEEEKSFLKGRSFCPHCKHTLSWQDLIPVLSLLILKGKCRYCRKPISWQYPLVELATGLIFVSIYNLPAVFTQQFSLLYQGLGGQAIFNFIYCLTISSFLIIIFVYDLKHYIIPDKVIYPAIVIAFIYNLLRLNLEPGRFSLGVFWAALAAAGFFAAIVLISKGKWMGIGDIKLAALMGLILGSPGILVALLSAFFIGAVAGLGLIAAGKKKLSSEVPFGPFLVTGTFIALFWGERIIAWYSNFFLLK